ncbi:MAG: hypothetical protein GY774_22090 [Planctomycetes bacterium]|nr:hypothetical protein [Planctomycetota bacterium]
MKAINLRKIALVILIIGIGTGYVRADKQELLTRLSRMKVEFEFKDVTFTEALDKIGSELGTQIVLSDEAQWKLPQGEATRLSASLKGSLADCLTEMLNAFFMRYTVSDDKITIYPRAELEHILGRPNTKQLELLKNIYAMKLSFDGSFSVENIHDLIRRTLEGISFLPYDTPQRMSEIFKMMSTDKGMSPVSLTVVLEQVGDKYRTPRWYLSGMNFPGQASVITMVNEEDFRKAKLDQVVDISFEGKRADRADVILQRLAGWTGMELLIEKEDPSWLEEKIVVNMQNIKLRQALRNIVSSVDGATEINIDDNVIEILGPLGPLEEESTSEKSKSAGSSGEGYVGKISIPIGEGEGKYFIEFMLRERDLTEELRKLREDKIKEILKKFSKAGNDALEITVRPQSYSILN